MAELLKQLEQHQDSQRCSDEFEKNEQGRIVTIDSDQVPPDGILFGESNYFRAEKDERCVVNGNCRDEANDRVVPPV